MIFFNGKWFRTTWSISGCWIHRCSTWDVAEPLTGRANPQVFAKFRLYRGRSAPLTPASFKGQLYFFSTTFPLKSRLKNTYLAVKGAIPQPQRTHTDRHTAGNSFRDLPAAFFYPNWPTGLLRTSTGCQSGCLGPAFCLRQVLL